VPAFSLVGVPVRVAAEDPEIVARLALCSAHCPDGPTHDGASPVTARAVRAAGGFTVTVIGREAVAAADLVTAVRSLNHEIMHAVMLRRPDLFFVHAGVVAFEDRAVVLPGLSRAGKSTLVLALVMAGARFLSDELMVHDPGAGRLLPFPRAPKVRDVCVPLFDAFADRFVGEGEGRFLPLDALDPRPPAPARPYMVVAPAYDPAGDDRLAPLSAGEGLLRLSLSALNFGTHRERSLSLLAGLAAAGPCHDLRWRDAHAAARSVAAAARGRDAS
jgi:hypothetical protein